MACSLSRIYLPQIFFFMALFLSACAGPGDSPLRMGYLQSDLHHLPAFVAIEKGLFKKEGLDVELGGIFKAGPEEMTAFSAGELDFGYVGQAPATAALLNKVADIQFVAQVNLEGSAIVCREEAGNGSPRFLSGKTVAIPGHATIQEFLLARALMQSGIQPREIKTIVLKPPEMLQALQQKNIDAFIAWQPYPAQAVVSGTGKGIINSSIIWKDHPCCVLIAQRELCRAKPEVIRKIQAAHAEACAFIVKNPGEALSIAQKYTGVDRAVLAEAIRHITFTEYMNKDRAYEFVEYLRSRKYLQARDSEELFEKAFFPGSFLDNSTS